LKAPLCTRDKHHLKHNNTNPMVTKTKDGCGNSKILLELPGQESEHLATQRALIEALGSDELTSEARFALKTLCLAFVPEEHQVNLQAKKK
jgi:hypothetical protein